MFENAVKMHDKTKKLAYSSYLSIRYKRRLGWMQCKRSLQGRKILLVRVTRELAGQVGWEMYARRRRPMPLGSWIKFSPEQWVIRHPEETRFDRVFDTLLVMGGNNMKRKRWTIVGGSVLAAGLAAVTITNGAIGGSATDTSTSTTGAAATSSNQVQIFSWWTAGGEANGLKALMKTYKHKYPSEDIINEAVAGGGGSNAKAVLASRMQANDPPETFQVHAGQELMSWVDAGKMQPLDSMYKSLGLNKVIPKQIISDLSKNGHVYAIPADVGRGNVLWYNPAVLKKYHLSPPTTMTQFMSELKTLKSKGVTPLAYGDKDQLGSVMLWENVLLATMGPTNYDKLWQGKIPFSNAQVKAATNTFLQLLNYTNSNHSALTWDEADQMVADGSAAFNLMGDWAKAYFQSKGLKEGTQFGWTAFPGTSKDFEYVIDAFGLPNGVKNPTGAKDFLNLLASKQGQDEFNPLKGSIPARTDANMKLYDKYSQEAMTDFKKDSLVPSLGNGEAANPAFETAATQAVTMLISTKNVSSFISALQTADEENPLS